MNFYQKITKENEEEVKPWVTALISPLMQNWIV